jgi:hypothetical protein
LKRRVISITWAFLGMTAIAATAQTEGVIISRTGDTLVIKEPDGKSTAIVVLTADTNTKDEKKEHLSNTVLIPGLKVEVDWFQDSQSRIVPKTITVEQGVTSDDRCRVGRLSTQRASPA